jgi:hypothetical protein
MKYVTAILKLFLIMLMLAWTVPAWAAEIGKVSALSGRADVTRGEAGAEELKIDDGVMQTDVIRTKSDSRLVLTMSDGSRLTMAENTRLELKHYQVEGEPAGLLKVTRGRLRALVSKVFSSRSESFQVRTPTAVAGVMGTDFAVIVEALFTRVVVFKGIVMVRNIDPNIPKREILRKNQSTIVWQGEPPLPPVSLKMLIEEVLGISPGSEGKGTEDDPSNDSVDGEGLPENGGDLKVLPPDDPIPEGDPPSTEPPPTDPPSSPGGPNPPPPAPPTDPPPPGKPDGPPGPPPSPPGQTKKLE